MSDGEIIVAVIPGVYQHLTETKEEEGELETRGR
jgi:hypothetical protein